MPTEAKAVLILEFLDETDLALPAKAIHVNLERRYRGVTWSIHATRDHLKWMDKQGFVERDDIGPGYFSITHEGREWYKERN